MIDIAEELQKYIHLSKYSRWVETENRRENWDETIDRYIDFWKDKFSDESDPWFDNTIDSFGGRVRDYDVMPSMRVLMTAGKALERDEAAGFNCSAIAVTHARVFDECFYLLMNGCGFGFSVERQYIKKLPCIDEEFYESESIISVRDSKIGWATAFKELISMLYNGQIPKWDLSKIRPAGARLKTFGGRASGPEPLNRLFEFTVRLFRNAKGRQLRSIECHDLLCKIADTVIVGSVRRSACISLSNLTDDRMRRAKTGQWWVVEPQRALANNSVAYTEKPDIDAFSKEWRNQYKSKSGERGIINKVALKEKAVSCGREYDGDYLVNPCFTGDMKLLTENGYKCFDELCDCSVNIINKDSNISKSDIWCSGEKYTISINFRNRDNITCTPDHVYMTTESKEVQAKDLKGKRILPFYTIRDKWDMDSFKAGFIQGDGQTGRLISDDHNGLEINIGKNDKDISDMFGVDFGSFDRRIYSIEGKDIAKSFDLSPNPLPTRILSDTVMSMSNIKSFLSGLFSANGYVVMNTRVGLKTSCYELAHQVLSLLDEMDISSYITTNKEKMVHWKTGDYMSKESYDVNISKISDIIKFATHISFAHQYKRDNLEKTILSKSPMVSSIKPNGIKKVYDFTEPQTHWGVVEGVIAHNCGEAILRDSGGFCNLSEVIIKSTDSYDDIKSKVVFATIIGTFQSTLTNYRYLRKIWKQNSEEERLLGVSLTGIMDHKVMSGQHDKGGDGYPELTKWLRGLKQVAIETNKKYANKLGIPVSKHITLVKPSGTVSILCNTSSGIHPRYSEYYIRRVRNDKKDPLSQLMIDSGIPYIEEGEKYVFEFFIKSPEHSVCNSSMSASDQLNVWKVYRNEFCDGNPSQTIYYTDNEYFTVADWVWNNWNDIGGLSFFPKDDHVYENAPLEAISKEKYDECLQSFPNSIQWDRLPDYEQEDTTQQEVTLACAGAQCEV